MAQQILQQLLLRLGRSPPQGACVGEGFPSLFQSTELCSQFVLVLL